MLEIHEPFNGSMCDYVTNIELPGSDNIAVGLLLPLTGLSPRRGRANPVDL